MALERLRANLIQNPRCHLLLVSILSGGISIEDVIKLLFGNWRTGSAWFLFISSDFLSVILWLLVMERSEKLELNRRVGS